MARKRFSLYFVCIRTGGAHVKKGGRMIRICTALMLGVMGATSAWAADTPNLIGNWNPTGDTAAARLGLPVSGWQSSTTPIYNLKPRPRVIIDSQEGRGFGGHEIFADGTKEPFVGVVKRDGVHALVSTARGNALVDLDGNTMEWCWMDNMDNVAVVSCDMMAREGGK